MVISDKERDYLRKVSQELHSDSLYRSLHKIDDDYTKSNVQDLLKEILDEATYNKVAAAFEVCVNDGPDNPFYHE